LGATDTFKGTSNTAYKTWLQEMQPTAAKHDFASFVGKKVADHADGVWTPGTVQVSSSGHSALHDAHIAGQHPLAQ
jgi:hypothetical protein